jgi:type I restriction-modification system DNA methylase subunit
MDYKNEFTRTLNEITRNGHRRPIDVFGDWVTMAASALYNFKKDKNVENEYLNAVKKYQKKELDNFAKMLSTVFLALEDQPEDILGKIYTENNFANKRLGQFLTPDHLSHLMAAVALGDKLEKNRIYTVSDPCCGSGGMLVNAVRHLREIKFDYRRNMLFYAQDIDDMCAKMSFIQLSVLQVPAMIAYGDSLADEKGIKWKRETAWCYQADIFSRLAEQNKNDEKEKRKAKQKSSLFDFFS